MKFLLDTHVLLWSLYEKERLPLGIQNLIENSEHEFYISVVSEYEVVIKRTIGKLELKYGFAGFLKRVDELNLSSIAIQRSHLIEYEKLPLHHRDPFDRLLIAQAKAEKMILITNDEQFQNYEVELIWK